MQIVKPYARLISIHGAPPTYEAGVLAMRCIENIARVSHRSEDSQTQDSWQRFIPAVVLQHGDWSVVEHVSATVEMVVDRGITHEIVRHRLFSYTQESTRFVNYEKKMPPSFIAPFEWPTHEVHPNNMDAGVWGDHINRCEVVYREMLNMGYAPQLARSVFPNALASKIIMTGNLRAWRHFLVMRTTKEAHPQMREVVDPLLAEFQTHIPLLYADIEPGMRQVDAMRLPR